MSHSKDFSNKIQILAIILFATKYTVIFLFIETMRKAIDLTDFFQKELNESTEINDFAKNV